METTKQYGKKFEEIYHAPIWKVYGDIIEKFFHGQNHFSSLDESSWTVDGSILSRGFIWIARHKGFETLTVEPLDGSQYEIAVRMPHGDDDEDTHFYSHSGYSINEWGTLRGYDTSGH
jgi:hypothetical protein